MFDSQSTVTVISILKCLGSTALICLFIEELGMDRAIDSF